jgi:hypothetical protein
MSSPNHRATAAPAAWHGIGIPAGTLQAAAGAALVLAAWVMISTDQSRAAASALVPGLLITTLYGADRFCFRAVLERAVLLIGIWALVAPWMLGFAANDNATWAHLAFGCMATVSAAAWLRLADAR